MIELPRAVYDEIVSRAYAGGDAEVCGVLAGTTVDDAGAGDDGGAGDDAEAGDDADEAGVTGPTAVDEVTVVERAYAADNVAERPQIRYRIDPEEQLELLEAIEADGLDAVGFYHSHPAGPTAPSETDAARATWPDRSYVICALDGYPFVGSWRWRADPEAFERETVAVRGER
ncbi:Mov34/MPN/PAD-1 family protein [Halorubrum tebenquichense]|uniref:Mov34/MPN/PAD-1 family protein n=1 Tax=Halorubrum tebenquichense DSM 14210 TaxID=1227485 RepID=M0DAC3_9EURY|nr:M67 family metallopeptidase [Halorubrum tebenquichense]ELZ31758.1 Mov34/MPN/PAD-1 family protein [Halorubrum tebenquichense DSM 14210]